ncbi:MAG: hypothetical protein J7L71_04370 [Spirochaetaceae bacterium]|nr:hypothetical protein [Spirochaetaceae bacterium]
MKKLLILLAGLLIITSVSFPLGGKTTVTGEFGVNFFGYETPYLTTGVLYQVEIIDGMDFVGGADFGIHTKSSGSGEIEADFLIPLKIGIYFPFDVGQIKFGFGTGLTPCFQHTYDSSGAEFLMGPYINGSIRLKVHPVMSVFLQV